MTNNDARSAMTIMTIMTAKRMTINDARSANDNRMSSDFGLPASN